MKCLSCDCILDHQEDSIIGSNTNERVQLCVNCLPLPELDDNFGYSSGAEVLDINDNIRLSDT